MGTNGEGREGKQETPETQSDEGFGRSLSATGVSQAERGGFEPPIGFDTYNGLANLELLSTNSWPAKNLHDPQNPPVAHGKRATHPAFPDLSEVISAWPELPQAIRLGILAMVRAAREERP
jgi:hypothetical protein